MANYVLFLLLLSLLSLVCTNYAKFIVAVDSDGREYNISGVVSPGMSITLTCPHSDVTEWSLLRLGSTHTIKSNTNTVITGNKLKINKVDFENSGLYYCNQNTAALRFFLHVLEITKVINGSVPINTVSTEMNGLIYNQTKINEKVSVSMSCFCSSGTNNTQVLITWKGGDYSKFSDLYTIETSRNHLGLNSTLTLKKGSNAVDLYGKYVCSCNVISGNSIDKNVFLEAPPMFINHDYSKRTTEGENVTIDCVVFGVAANNKTPITWTFNKEAALRDGITMKYNLTQPNYSQLIISKVTSKDRGVYTCQASNDFGFNTASTMLRVKGRYAALWPFIGIVIQFIILIVIIVVYEYKKTKKVKEDASRGTCESKNEPDAMGSERGNESVRQRLVKA